MSAVTLTRGSVPDVARRAAERDPLYVTSLVVLGVLVLAALLGRILAPYDPNELFVGPVNGGVSFGHPFGTDDLGRDIFSRVLFGTSASLLGPVLVVILSTVLGMALAIVAAWYGGLVSSGIGRVVDLIFAIPGLVMAVLAVAMFGRGLLAPVLALSLAYIPVVTRLVQTAATRELAKPYMAALQIQGVSSPSMCLRHLVPAILPVVTAQLAIGFGYAMLDLSAISFLGLGERPPFADWGSMVAAGQSGILTGAPEQALFPALLIVITVLAVGIVGARVTAWAEEKEQ